MVESSRTQNRPTGWGGPPVAKVPLLEIETAARLIAGRIVRTPLLPFMNAGATGIFLKPENLQPSGSFKIRGVLNWAESLSAGERSKGLATASAGNTAQALGYVARMFGAPARSLVIDTVPKNKIDAMQAFGVEPIVRPMDAVLSYMFEEQWRKESYRYLNPWGEPKMIAGSGTIGLEILEDLPRVDTVYVPVGGGGLIAGIGCALKARKSSVRVIGVQPEASPSLRSAFKAKRPVWIKSGPTICEGAVTSVIVDQMYPLLREVVDDVVVISEETAKNAIRRLALEAKLTVEGAGALALAAALQTPVNDRGTAACVLSGGNISAERLRDAIGNP